MKQQLPPLLWSLARILARVAVLLVIVYGVHLLMNWVMIKSAALSPTSQSVMLTSLIALLLFSYAILIAVPFVPGIELGMSLILLLGAPIAPFVFSATFLGLTLAFVIGRYMPRRWLQRTLLDLRLKKAAGFWDKMQEMTPEQRVELMCERLPDWLGPHLVKWRYVMLAAVINIPGNSIIGGGGGICMIAGLSRIFTPAATLATIALAVSPVPLFIWFFGIEFFS